MHKTIGRFCFSGNNLSEFVRFLVKRIENNCSFLGNLNIIVAFDELCIPLLFNGVTEALNGLLTNHKEADTTMLFHAKLIGKRSNADIAIQTPEPDVFVMSC